MKRKISVLRWIYAILILLCTAYLVYVVSDAAYQILNVEYGGFAALGLIIILIYGIAPALFIVITQIVLLILKKFWIVDFVLTILFILSYASLYLVPAIISTL